MPRHGVSALRQAIRSLQKHPSHSISSGDDKADKGKESDEALSQSTSSLSSSSAYALTGLHADFVLCCLKAQMHRLALCFLDAQLYSVSPLLGCTPKDFLLYCYYSGLVYCALKKFPKALESFSLVFNTFIFKSSCVRGLKVLLSGTLHSVECSE